MKGASAEPCAKISSTPTSSMVMMMGNSHHFFRTRMKAHNSLVMLEPLMDQVSLKLVFHCTALSIPGGSPDPEASLQERPPNGVLSEETHDPACRRQDQEVDDPHEDGGRDSRQQVGKPHPGPVDWPQPGRHPEAGQNEHTAEGHEDERRRMASAPPEQAGQRQESGADGRTELPPLFGSQSSWNSCRHALVSFHSGCSDLFSRNGPSTKWSMWVRMKH